MLFILKKFVSKLLLLLLLVIWSESNFALAESQNENRTDVSDLSLADVDLS